MAFYQCTKKSSSGGGGASVVQKTLAEYEALPTADKMNGSIYKITDKALIYCLDEEYHAVKEITSADYALLTSDEKNNGTLYIITDEETTAADIPYSAGVSVADKLDSLSGIKITKTSLSAVFSNSNISANIGNAKTLFGLDNDDTIDYIGSFCNGQPLVAFTNSTGGLFCGAVLGQLNSTYSFTAICFYH